MRRRPLQIGLLAALAIGVAALVTGLAATAREARPLRVTAKKPLIPRFDPAIHDYVSRCSRKHRLELVAQPASGGTVAVAGGAPSSSTVRVDRHVRWGQQVGIVSRVDGHSTTYHVRCLPGRFPHWSIRRRGRTQAAFYVVTLSHYVAIFDSNGVPVWWMHSKTVPFDAKLLPNGHLAWSRHRVGDRFGVERRHGGYEEHRLSGGLVRVRRTAGSPTDHHDMQPLPNGDWVMISYRRRNHVDMRRFGGVRDAVVYDAVIQEVDGKGRVVWQWSSRHRISPRQQGERLVPRVKLPDGTPVYDLMHMNAVQFHGHRMLISAHNTNAVYDVDRRTKRIVWKLGGTKTPRRLKTLHDPHEHDHLHGLHHDRGQHLFGGQHDARLLPDGTVTVHDNGTGLSRPPRAVRYRIDERARTASLLEDVKPERDLRTSNWGGSVTRMPGGHWVVSWGDTPVVAELTPTGRTVLRLRFPRGWSSYKVDAVRPGALRIGDLRRAMDRMPQSLRR